LDKRLFWMVMLFGVLVLAGGLIGWSKGSAASAITASPLAGLMWAFALLSRRGVAWARRATCIACATVGAVMLSRTIQTGHLLPGIPVAALGLALAAVLFRNDRPAT